MKIAYLLNTYPQPSHSFIRRELAAIEAEGHAVLRLAMRRSEAVLQDPLDQAEAEKTRYILDAGLTGLAVALILGCVRRPAGFGRALFNALKLGAVSEVGMLRHLIYLAEACRVLPMVRRAGIDHVHAHFGTNAAAVAYLMRALGGPRYSFTVHGPEEFDAPRALSLGDKLDYL